MDLRDTSLSAVLGSGGTGCSGPRRPQRQKIDGLRVESQVSTKRSLDPTLLPLDPPTHQTDCNKLTAGLQGSGNGILGNVGSQLLMQ